MRVETLVFLALALIASDAAAQARRKPIEPGSPGNATAATTVGSGLIQVESGVAYSHTDTSSGVERRFSVESSLRLGLTETVELRVDGEPIVSLGGPDRAVGSGDYVLNLVWYFTQPRPESSWPALAVQPFLKVPTATGPIGSGKTDFGALMLASFDLPGAIALDVNAGMAAVGQTRPSGWLLQAIVGATATWAPDNPLAPFIGVTYFSREERGSGDRLSVQAGLLWRVTHDFALDASVETGLLGQTPEYLPRPGFSLRFGRSPRRSGVVRASNRLRAARGASGRWRTSIRR